MLVGNDKKATGKSEGYFEETTVLGVRWGDPVRGFGLWRTNDLSVNYTRTVIIGPNYLHGTLVEIVLGKCVSLRES